MVLLTKSKLAQKREKINADLFSAFPKENRLFEAISYAIMGSGKRVRPLIVLLIAEALGNKLDVSKAALALEFFHTASLIADDLPCMDNEELRRDKPTLHKVYGESIALLSSYGLISEAFRKIHENGEEMKKAKEPFSSMALEATSIALECASRCAGVQGATLGQYLDLFPIKQEIESIEKVIALKTITLFEGSFVLGWVFGGGDFTQLERVKELAKHFGMAFQIRDDILDMEEDFKKKEHANIALVIGKQKAMNRFFQELEKFKKLLKELDVDSASFEEICKKLTNNLK